MRTLGEIIKGEQQAAAEMRERAAASAKYISDALMQVAKGVIDAMGGETHEALTADGWTFHVTDQGGTHVTLRKRTKSREGTVEVWPPAGGRVYWLVQFDCGDTGSVRVAEHDLVMLKHKVIMAVARCRAELGSEVAT